MKHNYKKLLKIGAEEIHGECFFSNDSVCVCVYRKPRHCKHLAATFLEVWEGLRIAPLWA